MFGLHTFKLDILHTIPCPSRGRAAVAGGFSNPNTSFPRGRLWPHEDTLEPYAVFPLRGSGSNICTLRSQRLPDLPVRVVSKFCILPSARTALLRRCPASPFIAQVQLRREQFRQNYSLSASSTSPLTRGAPMDGGPEDTVFSARCHWPGPVLALFTRTTWLHLAKRPELMDTVCGLQSQIFSSCDLCAHIVWTVSKAWSR